MTDDAQDNNRDVSTQDEKVVRRELERVREFVKNLSMDDLKQGNWFANLLTFSLDRYVKEVNAGYFRRKYPDLPADAVVQERIQMAARYASIEGGLSAAAYTGAVAATIGSGGAASPLTLPAGGASFAVDMVYTSQLQLRLAYDIAVLYGVPLDVEDPDDLWKLIRIAFVIKSGEVGGTALMKGVPALVRPVVKKVFSKGTLAAAKSLPVVGKHLLQRNVIKFAIPGVGVPLSAGVNYWTTKTAGGHAREVFRLEAKLMEEAERIAASTPHHRALPWIMWTVACSDGPATTSQHLLLHHVTRHLRELGSADEALDELRAVIEVDRARVWGILQETEGDLQSIYRAAVKTVAVRGKARAKDLALLERVADLTGADHSAQAVRTEARGWA
ncbi:hypothetical protein ASG73_04715 [Janibacter sp. Soil728]|uniref:hypothetical protein n=1 Tax=Janibacter sp. Soil728 TaxID=1736393 RepID=UPI0006F9C5AB|nr:hypothetical protein [Janibacter sp. Soil728]KRE38265.1 hypothetical protein ASG73_04715 [Janibacter sp. Soil728]